MSTPAANTRQRKRFLSQSSNISPSKISVSGLSVSSVQSLQTERERKCKKKQQAHELYNRRKQQIVRQWLNEAQRVNPNPLHKLKKSFSATVPLTKPILTCEVQNKQETAVNKHQTTTEYQKNSCPNKQIINTDSVNAYLPTTQSFVEEESDRRELDISSTSISVYGSALSEEEMEQHSRPSRSAAKTATLIMKLRHQDNEQIWEQYDEESLRWQQAEFPPDKKSYTEWGENQSNVGDQPEQDSRNSQSDHDEDSQESDSEEEHDQQDPHNTVIEKPMDEAVVKLSEYKERLEAQDNSVFYDMFELMITKMSTVQEAVTAVKQEQKALNKKVSALESSIEKQNETAINLTSEIEDVVSNNAKLIESTLKFERNFSYVNTSMKNLQKVIRKGEFLVHGIMIDEDLTYKEMVENFLKQVMKIDDDLEVVSAHPMGKKLNSPIWFKIHDPDDTATIFENVSNLKEKVNAKKARYRIKEFLSEADRETDSRNLDMIQDNRRMPMSHQVALTRQKGKLVINGEVYKKAVQPPSLKQILLDSTPVSLQNSNIHKGDLKMVNGSAFYTYSTPAASFEQIQQAYKTIKALHISSSSIMCGYRIFGVNHFNLQDFSDDGEHGGGRVILKQLKDAGVWNIAVFVVRYHDGPQLGAQRFKTIEDLAKDVIASTPGVLNRGQGFRDQNLLNIFNEAEKQKAEFLQKRANRNQRGGATLRGDRGGRGRGGARPQAKNKQKK